MGAMTPLDGVTLADLPLPAEPRVDESWTRQMREWAEVMGPLAVLQLVDALGGQPLYVPKVAEGTKLEAVIGLAAAEALSGLAGGDSVTVPTAKAALLRARRAGVIAAIRTGEMTIADGSRLLGTSRNYLSYLVRQTDEGADAEPVRSHRRVDPRQRELFVRDAHPDDAPSADGP